MLFILVYIFYIDGQDKQDMKKDNNPVYPEYPCDSSCFIYFTSMDRINRI